MADPVTLAISAVTLIWEIIRGTKNLIKPDDPNILKNSRVRKEFLNNNPNAIIVNIGGNLIVGDVSQLKESGLCDKFKEKFSEGSKSRFDVIDNDFFDRIQKMKKNSAEDKRISPFLQFLAPETRNILSLSVYAKKLFDMGDFEEGRKIKEDIGGQYGKEGRKLSNLYSSGYVDGMIEYLEAYYQGDTDKIKGEINDKIIRFTKESENIIFIHSASVEEDIILEIRRYITMKKPYIALHGGGVNIEKVNKIVEVLRDEITRARYDLNMENLKTLSMCPLLNVYITLKSS